VKPNLRLFTIKTHNIEQMTDFYNKILDRTPDEVESDRLVEYKFDGSILGLYNPRSDDVANNKIIQGNNCIPAFKLGEDFESEMERIEEITDLEYQANQKGHRWFVFKDPEGNRVEMYRGSI
jgi:catechol-2,3-dioxygenase